MSDPITIRIPATPARALSPNHSREMHWRHAYDARQALRQATKAGLCNSPTLLPLSLPTPVMVHFTVAWEKRRKTMDGDNLLASLKACIDTIAGYVNVDDRAFIFAPIKQERDPDGIGFMIVELKGAA